MRNNKTKESLLFLAEEDRVNQSLCFIDEKRSIKKEVDKLNMEIKWRYKYDFEKVKSSMNAIVSIKDKIKYLIDIKTSYLQNKNWGYVEAGVIFDKQCDLEIKKLKAILRLENEMKPSKASLQLSEYTNSQLVLIF